MDPATEVSREDYNRCSECFRTRAEHHYGVDGPAVDGRAGFAYTSTVLYCPGHSTIFKKAMHGACVAVVLALSLSGCLPMAAVNLIKNDNQCEAYNSDVERGVISGPLKVCKEPAFRF